MIRHTQKLRMLLSVPVFVLAGCSDESTSPLAVAERSGAVRATETVVANPATSTAAPTGSTEATAEPSSPAVASPAAPAPAAVTKDVTFDTVKLDLAKDQPFERKKLTPDVLAIDNQPIRIRGYILPSFQQTGIKQFVLVRDNQECCFGPGAALHDCIVVDMKPGLTTQYTVRPVAVEGVFSIREMLGIDGKHLAIYHLDGVAVE